MPDNVSPSAPQPSAPEPDLGAAWTVLWRRLGVKAAVAVGLLALAAVGYFAGVEIRTKAAEASGHAAGRAFVTPEVRAQMVASSKHTRKQSEMALAGLRPGQFADGDGSYFASYFMVPYEDTFSLYGRDTVVRTKRRPCFMVSSRMLGGRWYWMDSGGTLHYSER